MSADPKKLLQKYRETVTDLFIRNGSAIANDTFWHPKEKAGTVLAAASGFLGAVTGVWREANEHLAAASDEAVMEDLVQLLCEVVREPETRKAPNLTVIDGGAS